MVLILGRSGFAKEPGRVTIRCWRTADVSQVFRRQAHDILPRMSQPALLLIHGAGVTRAVWDPLLPFLSGIELRVPERPRTGDMRAETAWLAEYAAHCFVVGMSGGATLGLALAETDVPLAGALLHEPAVGSLAPGLLAPIAAAYASGGVPGFGTALYGPSWRRDMSIDTQESLGAELTMFRAFEPGPPSTSQGPITISVGEHSPDARHDSVAALAARFGYPTLTIRGARHFVAVDSPAEFAAAIIKCSSPAQDENTVLET
jgi:pimeloyl-ACP methyl ester carboxylesterase